MRVIAKHYAVFYSPGTFFLEQTSKEIASWDIAEAVKLSKTIMERYNATPHSFRFETYNTVESIKAENGEEYEVKDKKVKSSGLYFLTGVLRTMNEVQAKNDPNERILMSNMKANRQPVIIENYNSFRFSCFFGEDDAIVDEQGRVVRRGNDADLMELRNSDEFRIRGKRANSVVADEFQDV